MRFCMLSARAAKGDNCRMVCRPENLKYLLEHLAYQAKASGIYPRIDDKTFESLRVVFPAACGDVKNIFLIDTPLLAAG